MRTLAELVNQQDETRRREWREAKRTQRRLAREARERVADAPPPSGFGMPPAPTDLRGVKRWIKAAHDAFTRRELTAAELNEVRRTAASMFEGSKAQADVRRSIAALEAAQAQTRMAEGLAGAEAGRCPGRRACSPRRRARRDHGAGSLARARTARVRRHRASGAPARAARAAGVGRRTGRRRPERAALRALGPGHGPRGRGGRGRRARGAPRRRGGGGGPG